MDTKRREQWRAVLEAEVKGWGQKTCAQLLAELTTVQGYHVEVGGKRHGVEVELLENTDTYVHVLVSVDDGSLLTSLHPLSESFIRQK
jgi:hypothetical protein